jgi:hypothetical protein
MYCRASHRWLNLFLALVAGMCFGVPSSSGSPLPAR